MSRNDISNRYMTGVCLNGRTEEKFLIQVDILLTYLS